MVELVQRHQVENGSFKNGTFSELQYMMEERAPGCGVRVEPHIRSRHKLLKKDFHAVHLLRNQSGCGWDNVTKTPTLDDDVFENIVKVFPNCKKLNRKPFPFYDELLKVFGKVGPANGRKTTPHIVEGHNAERFMEDLINEGVEMSQRAAATTSTHKAVPPAAGACDGIRKRAKKTENKTDDAIVAVADELCGLKPVISKALDALGSILEDREEETGKEAALMAEIGKIEGLERCQVLDAAMALVENDRKTKLFYALDNEEDRKYFIQNLLR
ncbi:unnamed protein product [Linum trigynum]|uniref:Myb/SANT-like domain-containing protein n=1 Tax=Linum trigynum TaxID=586398 RepID=A0AAV2FU01_9ROSI